MGEHTRFGGGRHVGTGYLVHSSRVGPAVILVHGGLETAWVESVAEDLNEDGFTVLVPELYKGAEEEVALLDRATAQPLLREAVVHMRMNWHPRVGLLSFQATALALAVADEAGCDAVVTFSPDAAERGSSTPLLWRASPDAESWGDALAFLHHHLS